jgi:hypothetical protein
MRLGSCALLVEAVVPTAYRQALDTRASTNRLRETQPGMLSFVPICDLLGGVAVAEETSPLNNQPSTINLP